MFGRWSREMTVRSTLSLLVILVLVALVILLVVLLLVKWVSPQHPGGSYVMKPGADGVTLNTCGQNRNLPCVFTVQYLTNATSLCKQLGSACPAFSYNESTGRMKVVNPSSAFTATSSDFFVAI